MSIFKKHPSVKDLLKELGVPKAAYEGGVLEVQSPIDGSVIGHVVTQDVKAVDQAIAKSVQAFEIWREIPAPKRGELVRILGSILRQHKTALGTLVTWECGKIQVEGQGEVQEMIDICDFAVGLSRQLYGLTIASERPQHVMQEQWLPLGPVGIITAFNFPVAVWAWNAALALVCGDSILWKPSEKTPLVALACQALFEQACTQFTEETGIIVPEGLSQLVIGKADTGEALTNDPRVALISATGSTRMGRAVGMQAAKRFGKTLLELGGNNAVIVTPSADIQMALPSIVFGAVGTAGQRCTTTRRAFIHRSLYENFCQRIETAYHSIAQHKIGNPLEVGTLVGPLIDAASYKAMQEALSQALAQGGKITFGKRVQEQRSADAYYVEPALVRIAQQSAVVCHETFAPILYAMPYDSLEEVMRLHNAVPQGLSSAIFTTDIREAEYFKRTSDCGIANVNIGTSGAEIGGAFGGEKETGGGRESGSDSWKVYMRRQTSTTYYGKTPPALAQGVVFAVE